MKKINLSKKQKIAIAIALGVVCTGGAVGYTTVIKGIERRTSDNQSQVTLYYVPDAEKIFINGILVPKQSKDFHVSSEQGELNEIKIKDGDFVKKDTLLYICKNVQISNEVEELKSQLEAKKKERSSADDESIKNNINLEVTTLQDKINKLTKKVYSYVYAPFEGKVYLNNTSGGESVNGPVMTLQSTDFYVDGKVNEYDLFKIDLDQEVEVMLYATKEKITGKITFIGDRPYSASGENGAAGSLSEYGVRIDTEQQNSFRNGLHIQGIAKYSESELKVPKSAVKEEDGKHYVFKVENDIAYKTEVTVVEKTDDFVIINEGLNQGDTLVRNLDVVNLTDGQNIYGNGSEATSQGGVVVE